MSHNVGNGPPPLPPRSPRHSVAAASPQAPYSYSYSSQQTLSPNYGTPKYAYSTSTSPSNDTSRSSFAPPRENLPPLAPADIPPPIPPRPVGWVIQDPHRESSQSQEEDSYGSRATYSLPPPPLPPKEPIIAPDKPPALPSRTKSGSGGEQSSVHASPHASPCASFQAAAPSQPERIQHSEIPRDRENDSHSASASNDYEGAESLLLETLDSLSISLLSPDIPSQSPRTQTSTTKESPVAEIRSAQRQSYASPTVECDALRTAPAGVPPPPKAIVSCLGLMPLAIPSTYAWHKNAPDFMICSKCYVDHIHGSRFHNEFQTKYLDDGEPRICRFSQPKIEKDLFSTAVKSGNLRPVLDWMSRRTKVPECVGVQGQKGGQGLKWYKLQPDDIPGFVCCEACYEDHVSATTFSSRFALIPPERHTADQAWACDLALPYVAKLCAEKSKTNDWVTFVAESTGRLAFEHCPQNQSKGTYKRLWFVPKNGSSGLAICAACWADNVLLTSEEDRWRQATEWWDEAGNSVKCSLGQMNIKMSMAQSQDVKDYSIFWNAVDKLSKSPPCTEKGITNGEWYTLPSNPEDFGICKACYVGICEPLNISHLFIPKPDNPVGVPLLCSLNASCGRFVSFMGRLVETYFTQSIASFDNFASTWARIPPCKRDEDVANRHWYGWFDCTICRECYHNFAANHPEMVARMELKDKLLPHNVLCEMYSPRMRNLFEETASSSPVNLKPLLEFSRHRRQVYMETVPQMRNLLFQAKMNSQQQMMLNTQSTFYHNMGLQNQMLYGSSYTYSAVGVGGGFANRDLLMAEQYKQQAMGLMGGMPSMTMQVGMLEQKWRAVE